MHLRTLTLPSYTYLFSISLNLSWAAALPSTTSRPSLPACTAAPNVPEVSDAKLPDPFRYANGDTVYDANDFTCRRQEILHAFMQYELGTLPSGPDSLTASLSKNTLTVSMTVGSNSAKFTSTITKGSFPGNNTSQAAMVVLDGFASIPLPSSLAQISFDIDSFAAQNGPQSRGVGTFYDLFGSNHSAGALTAWAWGASRLVDALELLGANKTGIDTQHLGVTGCSRNGKGAFVIGALEPRFALTIPQESGSGGAACWRISDQQLAAGNDDQTAGEIVTENVWFSPRFNAYVNGTSSLPYDHHMLAALIAPRGLYVPENDIEWLGPVSTSGCMQAGHLVYEALGVPENFGFSLVGNHAHCSFPAAQEPEVAQFIDYFLLGGGTKPDVIMESSYFPNETMWVDWPVPTLA